MSSRWLLGQRLALGCVLLRCGFWDRQREVLTQLHRSARPPEDKEAQAYRGLLQCLPPTTMKGLANLPRRGLGYAAHLPIWQEVAGWQTKGREKAPSPVVAARIIADRIVNSNLSAAQIQRLTKLELLRNKSGWPDEDLTAIEELQHALRRGEDGAAAIPACGGRIRGKLWGLVENDLLQREFAWPLVVAKDRDGTFIECSLPIGIRVTLNPPQGQLESAITGRQSIDAEGWREPLLNALKAAKQLWIYKHTSWDAHFARLVKSARVTLDLSVAERVIEPYADFCDFSLADNSHGAYLASIIASRFFGHTAVDTVCATGAIGPPKPDPGGGSDYFIDRVNGTESKLAYAERAAFFDQIIIPKDSEPECASRPGLRVRRGRMLSDYVEHVAGQSWRKHRYVRAPDFHAAYMRFRKDQRGEGLDPAPGQEWRIRRVLADIFESTDPVIAFGPDILAEDVAAALYKINQRSSEGDYGRRNNLGLAHYTIVRALPEGYDRFWQTVWEALEGDPGDLDRIGLFSSTETVGRLIAGRMNWFKPTPERPRRAPDILVILDYDRLPQPRGVPNGPDRRLALDKLLPVLSAELRPCTNQFVSLHIGTTRILLVASPPQEAPSQEVQRTRAGASDTPRPGPAAEPEEEPEEEPAEEIAAPMLRRLAAFRNGFTWEMARRISELGDGEFVRLLDAVENPLSGEAPLRYSKGAVEYYLPHPGRYRPAEADGATHYSAAQAILGFLDSDPHGHRLDVGLGLSARWRQEAQWHLGRARRAKGAPEALRQRCRLAQERLNRIAEPLSWSRLRWAAERSGEEGIDTWDAFDARLVAARTSPHPYELLMMARFAHRIRDSKPEHSGRLRAARDRYATQAMAECTRFAPSEAAACRFVVASTRSCFIIDEAPTLAAWRSAYHYNHIARQSMQDRRVVEILDPEWFEYEGDERGGVDFPTRDLRCLTEREAELLRRAALRAAPLYRLGFLNEGIHGAGFFSIAHLVKWLGAMHEAQRPVGAKELAAINAMNPKQRDWYSKNKRSPSGLAELPSAQSRWFRGCEALERLWRQHRESH